MLFKLFILWFLIIFGIKAVAGSFHYFKTKEWPIVIPEMKVTKGVYLFGFAENTVYTIIFALFLFGVI